MIFSIFRNLIKSPKHIIIVRFDNVGDIILTFPLVGLLKQKFPDCTITFLTRNYTQAIVNAAPLIDDWLSWDELAALPTAVAAEKLRATNADVIIHSESNEEAEALALQANIPHRIGFFNSRNLCYSKRYCNLPIYLKRRNRDKTHMSSLSLPVLKFFGLKCRYLIKELMPFIYLNRNPSLIPQEYLLLLDKSRFNLILHPGSNGHAREWPVENFKLLINNLPPEKFKIFITGYGDEETRFADLLAACPNAINLINKMSLSTFISFIAECDGLVACSTGPLHIAAASGIHCLGLFTPQRHRDVRCWQPLGPKAEYISKPGVCTACDKLPICDCINYITMMRVKNRLLPWLK